MAEHTPGPWRLGDYAELYGWEVHRPGGGVFLVARVQADTEDHVEGKANARLIAASPNLLEAAKAVLSHHEHGHYDPDAMYRLGEAVRRAEGR